MSYHTEKSMNIGWFSWILSQNKYYMGLNEINLKNGWINIWTFWDIHLKSSDFTHFSVRNFHKDSRDIWPDISPMRFVLQPSLNYDSLTTVQVRIGQIFYRQFSSLKNSLSKLCLVRHGYILLRYQISQDALLNNRYYLKSKNSAATDMPVWSLMIPNYRRSKPNGVTHFWLEVEQRVKVWNAPCSVWAHAPVEGCHRPNHTYCSSAPYNLPVSTQKVEAKHTHRIIQNGSQEAYQSLKFKNENTSNHDFALFSGQSVTGESC